MKKMITEISRNIKTGKLILILCVLFAVLTAAVGCTDDKSGALEGTYSLSISGAGNASYTFSADGTGVRSYTAGEQEIVEEFSYSVDVETITFIWKDSKKTVSHSFAMGSVGKREAIWINEEIYYKQ